MALNPVTDPIELPLIDISKCDDPEAGKALLDATIKYGFLYVDSRATSFTKFDVEQAFALVCPNNPQFLPLRSCASLGLTITAI
jgi:hypothetical protein